MQPTQAIHPKLLVVVAHAAGLLLVAISAAAFHQFVYVQMTEQQEEADHRAGQLRGLLQNSIETRRLHLALERELEGLAARVARSQELTPGASREYEFLSAVTRVAEESGLEIEDYRRGHARHLVTHSEVDVQLSAKGSHAGICNFLVGMEAVARAKRVTDMTIATADDADEYPVTMAYTLYFGLKTRTPAASY